MTTPPYSSFLGLGLLAGVASAQVQPEAVALLTLPTVSVSASSLEPEVEAASHGIISAAEITQRSLLRPADVLELVPGMVVTQHSGDGKANQYFLRGFNLDHGTDFATRVNGVPVNMPTHAHGQGYSDLNFLIPEIVQSIAYRKGPYDAGQGDFSSAGSADISYRQRLDAGLADVSLGPRAYARAVVANSWQLSNGRHLLMAVERMNNDGPWTVPEGLRKLNGVLTLSEGSASRGWSASLMSYQAHWTATDQVPQRLIDAGTYNNRPFGRYDSLDPSSGGNTSRHSASVDWHHTHGNTRDQLSAYAMRYELQLFSNFTYALDRPADGDQFAQTDARNVMGVQGSRTWALDGGIGQSMLNTLGFQVRADDIAVGLYDSVSRRITSTVREDRVAQTLTGVYADNRVAWAPWFKTIAGVRVDQLSAQVRSLSNALNSGSSQSALVSPKLSLILGPWHHTEFFMNAGYGFHSNDARGTVIRVDPRDSTAQTQVPGLVKSFGQEVGLKSQVTPALQTVLTVWQLDLDSELFYKGDAGTTEAGRPSRRTGVEFNNRWSVASWVDLQADLAWSQSRYNDGLPDERIPNAVSQVGQLSVNLKNLGPWSAALQLRHIGSAPLNGDGSANSALVQTLNMRASYKVSPKVMLYADAFNLTNAKVDDIQYFYASRLRTDPANAAISGLHVHPAEPLSVRLGLRVHF
jgi:outer membrane cobalamin receptor